jgi:hypothetical protein
MQESAMSGTSILILALGCLVAGILIGFLAFWIYRNNRSRHLRKHFGPEYSRLTGEKGAVAAERELAERERRVTKFHIHPLSVEQKRQFVSRWQDVQEEFVDKPKESLAHADDLLGEAMSTRGYPVQDFDQRAADLSVDHPAVVHHYHAAHSIALRHREGRTTTEDLRQAMLHYRALFDDLMSDTPGHAAAAE